LSTTKSAVRNFDGGGFCVAVPAFAAGWDPNGPAAMAMMNLIAIVLIAAGTFLLIVSMP
jgi:hypothetical protein